MTALRGFDRLADRLRLHRQVDDRPIAVVEGPADARFLERVIPDGALAVFEAGSRDEVLSAAQELAQSPIDRVACVVDRDFDDEVAEAEASGWPVAPYDGGDLEAM